MRIIYAKRTGKRDSSVGGEESQGLGTPTTGHKHKRKVEGVEEDDDEDDDSNDLGEEDDEEEDGGKKCKKTETCEEEVCTVTAYGRTKVALKTKKWHYLFKQMFVYKYLCNSSICLIFFSRMTRIKHPVWKK